MRIKDITLDDIRHGKNWRVISPENIKWTDILLEEIPIEECSKFGEEDLVVYSGIFVTDDGKVKPIVMIKEAFSLEYGGDYCDFVNGQWRQIGLEPDLDAPFGSEYYANPLDEDESFSVDDDERKWHRDNFKKYIELV